MEVIGYRIRLKFPGLALDEGSDVPPVEGGVPTESVHFEERLLQTHGLVLYHGTERRILSTLCSKASEKQFAVLVVSLDAVSRPLGCDSPYIHFYSTGLTNPRAGVPTRVEQLVQQLVKVFQAATELPDESEMKRLWAEVDPRSDVMLQLAALENAIYAGPDPSGRIGEAYLPAVQRFYSNIPSYAELRQDYLRLCRSGCLKKNLASGT